MSSNTTDVVFYENSSSSSSDADGPVYKMRAAAPDPTPSSLRARDSELDGLRRRLKVLKGLRADDRELHKKKLEESERRAAHLEELLRKAVAGSSASSSSSSSSSADLLAVRDAQIAFLKELTARLEEQLDGEQTSCRKLAKYNLEMHVHCGEKEAYAERLETKVTGMRHRYHELKRHYQRVHRLNRQQRVVNLELTRALAENQDVDTEGVATAPWRRCEVCGEPFAAATPSRVPRVLRCGHTICTECARREHRGQLVECPFDRAPTFIERVDDLTRNLIVIHQ